MTMIEQHALELLMKARGYVWDGSRDCFIPQTIIPSKTYQQALAECQDLNILANEIWDKYKGWDGWVITIYPFSIEIDQLAGAVGREPITVDRKNKNIQLAAFYATAAALEA